MNVRLERPTLHALDAWIATQPEPKPSRPEAIRRLLSQALAHSAWQAAPAPAQTLNGPGAEKTTYQATRLSGNDTVDEWRGEAPDDEAAAHRLAQHLKSKLDEGSPVHATEDLLTLTRPDGEIVTVARAGEMVERLHGWKTSPNKSRDSDAD